MKYPECNQRQSAQLRNACLRVLLAALCLSASLGCNSFGNAKLVKQLQLENERLLTEFRAERQRREESDRLNTTLEARLSESEKLLARQTQGTIPNRLSSLPQNQSQNNRSLPNGDVNAGGANNSGAADPRGNSDFQWQRRVN